MKTTRKRERDRAKGEDNIFCTREQDFSLRGLWIFFFSFPVFVVTDISPHFPGIKNPFWIIHSILNLAATCIHNKLNLQRRFWDLSWMCQWQTTKILSFIFNTMATGRVTCSHVSKALRKMDNADIMNIENAIHVISSMKWGWGLFMHLSKRHSNPFHTKTETTPLNCHPWLPPKQREVGSSFPHGYPGNEARKLDSRRQPLSAPSDMPQIPLKDSFRGVRNMPDYFCHLYFSFSLQCDITIFVRKAIIFHSSLKKLCLQLSVQGAV